VKHSTWRKIPTIDRAAELYADEDSDPQDRSEALEQVLAAAVLERERLVWSGGSVDGYQAQITCLAVSVLLLSETDRLTARVDDRARFKKQDLSWWQKVLVAVGWKLGGAWEETDEESRVIKGPVWRALNDMMAYMPYGNLYAHSGGLCAVLAAVADGWKPAKIRFLDDGSVVTVNDLIDTGGRPFTVAANRVLLTNHYEELPGSGGRYGVDVSARTPQHAVKQFDLFRVRVTFHSRRTLTAPVLQMTVPGHIHPMYADHLSAKGPMIWELPFQGEKAVEVHFCAIRRGRASLRLTVADPFGTLTEGSCVQEIEVN
jgi:hypothetical protein